MRPAIPFPALLLLLGLGCPSALRAESPGLRIGGFVDTYYAFDFNRPSNFDRAYTTQPARHDEFNVNLAFLEAVLPEGPDSPARGRLARAGAHLRSKVRRGDR